MVALTDTVLTGQVPKTVSAGRSSNTLLVLGELFSTLRTMNFRYSSVFKAVSALMSISFSEDLRECMILEQN